MFSLTKKFHFNFWVKIMFTKGFCHELKIYDKTPLTVCVGNSQIVSLVLKFMKIVVFTCQISKNTFLQLFVNFLSGNSDIGLRPPSPHPYRSYGSFTQETNITNQKTFCSIRKDLIKNFLYIFPRPEIILDFVTSSAPAEVLKLLVGRSGC